ncbi:MAG: ABC transporter permease [Deltaproteobacteria bacterium]|jgi:ABC-type nitrate/sulfonate/bicarbonate transport system permease component|nr:ABC transporter permease [Deltaproteobacteria bacterium]
MQRYETKGIRLILREAGYFFKNALGSIFSLEFLTILIPLLALWELLPRLGVLPRTLVPPPSDVAAAFWDLLLNRHLLEHLGSSMGKFFLGLGIAIVTAIPIGIFMGWNLAIRKRMLPLFQLLAPVPPPAWVPLTIVFLGIGLPMQTFLIFLGAFYPILFNTYQAVKDTEPRYLASARVFGASELTLILRVYIWHALGSIIMSVKTGVAMGLVMLIIAEMYGGRSGIGYMLVEAKDYFQIPVMVVCMVILGIVGWFLIEILKFVELKLAVWKVGR